MDFNNVNDPEQREALNAIKKAAERKLEPSRKALEKKTKERVIDKLEDNQVDEGILRKIAAAAVAADAINRQQIGGTVNINDNLQLEADISPREKAIKLLYNKSF